MGVDYWLLFPAAAVLIGAVFITKQIGLSVVEAYFKATQWTMALKIGPVLVSVVLAIVTVAAESRWTVAYGGIVLLVFTISAELWDWSRQPRLTKAQADVLSNAKANVRILLDAFLELVLLSCTLNKEHVRATIFVSGDGKTATAVSRWSNDHLHRVLGDTVFDLSGESMVAQTFRSGYARAEAPSAPARWAAWQQKSVGDEKAANLKMKSNRYLGIAFETGLKVRHAVIIFESKDVELSNTVIQAAFSKDAGIRLKSFLADSKAALLPEMREDQNELT